MFKNKQKGKFWSVILAAFLLCVGAIIGVEAAVSLCNGGEGAVKLFFGVVFLLLGARRASRLF